ncbi:MAG: hypothetical protein NVS4B6_22520 [Mycobacterium sp.]
MGRASMVTLMAALAWSVAACGAVNTSGGSSAPSSQSMTSPTPSTWPQPQPGGELFDVTIAKGRVTPANATWRARAGQPITVRMNSDATDELHVHSSPDHEFEVAVAPNQAFTFSVEVPGSVAIELHHLHKTVATLHV